MINANHRTLSVCKHRSLPSISRSSFYFEPKGEVAFKPDPMRMVDENFFETPL